MTVRSHDLETSRVHVVILCGGSGTRLWPLSRRLFPKQFISLGGPQSLLQTTVERAKRLAPPERRWVVIAPGQEQLVQEQIQGAAHHILVEPAARNTAAAIALAAHAILKHDPQAVMVVISSDHSIQNVGSFEQTILDGIKLAENDFFVTVGIQPTTPATGFGYIEQGLPLDESGHILSLQQMTEKTPTAYSVRSFREKPNYAAAEQFLRTGRYLWNAGIFIWRASTFWNAFSHLQPVVAEVVSLHGTEDFYARYQQLDHLPIDVAFIEQTSHVACVPALFDWNDVGSWAAVRSCFGQNTEGNSLSGDVFALETKNSVVHSTGPFVSVIGLENIAVVATADAVLVMPLERSEEVKKVIAHLSHENRNDLL